MTCGSLMRGGCEFPIEHEGPCSQTVAKRRATRLSVDQVRAVDQFAELLFVMFPHAMGVAVVGSSLTRDDWRDVDIRIIAENNMVRTLRGILDLDDLHMLLSQWGQRVTGLPIDCQLQERSDHEREAYTEDGAPRFHWRGHGRIGDNARRLRDAASELFPDDDPESEVVATDDLTGLYQKCPDCRCDRICARDGKPIVDLDKLRSPSEVAAPEGSTT